MGDDGGWTGAAISRVPEHCPRSDKVKLGTGSNARHTIGRRCSNKHFSLGNFFFFSFFLSAAQAVDLCAVKH